MPEAEKAQAEKEAERLRKRVADRRLVEKAGRVASSLGRTAEQTREGANAREDTWRSSFQDERLRVEDVHVVALGGERGFLSTSRTTVMVSGRKVLDLRNGVVLAYAPGEWERHLDELYAVAVRTGGSRP